MIIINKNIGKCEAAGTFSRKMYIYEVETGLEIPGVSHKIRGISLEKSVICPR